MSINYKVKMIVGYRKDQEHSIDANEAHKAYYLFLNPDARSIFSNGLALKGSQIDEIIPDWQGTMGWNPSHVLDAADWEEISSSGAHREMQNILSAAKEIATLGHEGDLSVPLEQLITTKYSRLYVPKDSYQLRGGGAKSIEEIKRLS